MNPELVEQVDALAAGCRQARPGDISTFAELLDQCETLRQLSEIHQIAGVAPPAEALAEHITQLIMGEAEDDETAMQVLRDAVGVLQTAVQAGKAPQPEAFPAVLNVPGRADVVGGDAEAGPPPVDLEAAEPETAPADAADGADDSATEDAAAAGAEDAAAATTDGAADAGAAVGDEDLGIEIPPASDAGLPQTGGDEGAFAADEELLAEYLAEQRNRLEEIEGFLLALEREADESALADLRRALHTIKGDSGFLGLSAVAQISHAAETYLEAARYPYDLEQLFAVKDWLARAFDDLAHTGHLSPATQASLRQALAQLGSGESAPAASGAEPVDAATAETDGYVPPPSNGDAPAVEAGAAPAAQAETAAEPQPPVTSGRSVPLTADESLLVDFISESKEHLDMASAQLLALESDPDNEEAINCVFRAFHTVKGIAGFLNLEEIQKLAHDTENLLDKVRRSELELSPPLIDLVFEALDWMTRLIGNVRTALQGDGSLIVEEDLSGLLARIKAAHEGRVQPVKGGGRTQRLGEILVEAGAVASREVDDTLQEVKTTGQPKKLGEALVERDLVTPSQVHAALKQQVMPGPQGPRKAVELKETLRVDYERLENMINTIGELVLAEAMISQDEQLVGIHSEAMDKKLYNLRQVSRKLQELGTTIRMVPISGTFQKMARLVRDLSRKSNKPVNFRSSGDETELDRAYVDLIADPLVHMIRNSVDHGIESAAERRKHGKPEEGVIELRAFHEGGNIHVEIRDDGQGLDCDRIFAKAVEKGLVAADERERITEQEVFQLIFLPGFSTAAQVTEVSGRGVGMDVVRRNIAELRGQVQIFSERQVGTTFKIVLPLTLALIDGMLVSVGEERFIFPVLNVVESTRPSEEMINTVVGKGEMISLRGRQLPLYRLGRLFGVPGAKDRISEGLVVVVENEGRQIGVMVDDLVGIQQTVIKSLASGLFDAQGLSGGSIMADGTVGLIVDIAGLIRLARSRDFSAAEALQQ